jgi:hypothetical protein
MGNTWKHIKNHKKQKKHIKIGHLGFSGGPLCDLNGDIYGTSTIDGGFTGKFSRNGWS